MKMSVVNINISVSRRLKEELAWAIHKQLQVLVI